MRPRSRSWLTGLAAGAVSLALVAPGTASSAPVHDAATAKSPGVRTVETPNAGGAGLVTQVAPYFGARPADLVAEKSGLSEYGSQTRFQQVIDGVEVYGGEIVASLDKSGALEAANGEVALATYGTFPAADQADAAKTAAHDAAVQAVATRGKLDAAKLSAKLQGPRWLDLGLVTRQPGSVAIPVYLYDVTGPGDTRWQAMVHASAGKALLAWDMAEHLNRVVCDANRTVIQTGGEDVRCGTVFPASRAEGQAPSAVQDVNQVYEYFGDTSDTYASLGTDLTGLIGVDYGDGLGKALRGTVRICVDGGCPYANAFWNGEQMAFGEGSSLGVIRSMSDPAKFGDPDRMRSDKWFDDEFFQDNGGVHFNSGVGNKAAYLIADGGVFNGQKMLGIGLARSEVLWHETQKVLTSGADYGDLAEGLRETCAKLAKKKKKSGMTKAATPTARSCAVRAGCSARAKASRARWSTRRTRRTATTRCSAW